ncbi:four and a half LIM domains protein 2-like isoform X1 [Lethenteron reissneri]|uniref:four and a half LIM domains protein 2-like isoform X1 n=1 Tax=Lethenteron reissneri TaxID=7753 RepID=UPI002AB695EB|nr:four and a half LIM domains protein 2-like isoform X1 [Lethenteron reissneri]XP_061430578.1 four and a half LIM domains protein 2-like isoform X1 [Lethenteron reissneri]XP_061430580.1 four and a half LIM domains protein 2-like isoform X1 [Lethenteron reissneri]
MSEARVSEMSEALDCGRCGRSLLGGRYALGPQGAPHCLPCYDSHLASSCERCSKPIGCGSKELSYQERHWHEECFRCARCSASLCAQPFLCQGEQLLCGDCYCSEVAERCSGCSKPIAPGSRRMEYNDASWHEGCFVCSRCDKPIGSGSFVPREDGNFCTACYESHVALRCTHCNEVMKEGGVRYEGRPWHRECFVCGACGAQLAGQRFTSRGDGDGAEPLCLDCHAGLYAHKCAACGSPITGAGGAKFISFEERHWHHECFACKGCNASLAGKGFIVQGDDIVCAACAHDS